MQEATSGGAWSNYQAVSEGDDDEFFDAPEETAVDFVLSMPQKKRTESTASEGNDFSGDSSGDDVEDPQYKEASVVRRKKKNSVDTKPPSTKDPCSDVEEALSPGAARTRRSCIPEKPNHSISLW